MVALLASAAPRHAISNYAAKRQWKHGGIMNKYNLRGTHFRADSPSYAMPPYQYRNNEMFTVKLETDPEYLRALVPEPMVVSDENLLVIYIGALHVTEPVVIDYGEAGIMVPVTLGKRSGTYMPVMYLDNVELLTSGREVWGFPKFPGEISWQKNDTGVEASVTIEGAELIHMQMDFQRSGTPVPIFDREHFLLKSVPSVDGKVHDVRQINSCGVRNDHRKEIWEGEVDLTLRSNADNPLGDIPIKRIVSSVYTVGDIILDKGELIHDYLSELK
jgi:acetoacetate decarboxylase